MADMGQLERALVRADAAGDKDAARSFASEIRKMRASTEKPERSLLSDIGQGIGNLTAGALRGAGSIGATILAPYDMAKDALNGKGLSLESNRQRRAGIDDGLQSMGAEPESMLYGAGKLAGEIAGTAGMGGALVGGALKLAPRLATAAPNMLESIGSFGMRAGAATGGRNVATRAVGSAIASGAAAGLVNPQDAAMGAGIGAITPGVLQLAGRYGSKVYNAIKGNQRGGGKLLADALGVSEVELQGIIKAANEAPESIIPGSKLTLSQALQNQGANQPSVKMLERISAGGPGGDALLRRYEDQGAARINALTEQGAQTYQGAAREEAQQNGSLIGSVLRTQAADDQAAARTAWEAVGARGASDGVALQFPLDAMNGAMTPLGRGTVGTGNDARAVLREAQAIGTETIKKTKPLSSKGMQDLVLAVRAAGGINTSSVTGKQLAGEIRNLRESGLNNIVRPNAGISVDRMAERMHESGFLPDNDPATLLELLRESATGNKIYSNGSADDAFARMAEMSQGAPPEAGSFPISVPYAEFQRLRRSSGALGAKVGERAGGETEASVLNNFNRLLTDRVDSAAAGNLLSGEVMPQGFREQYNAARGMTRTNAERYKGGNNIASILRKPVGQDYTLNGDEVMNKLWHGGSGLQGDVANLKNVLSDNNREGAMNALRKSIMTDAAGKTTASGQFGAALPQYVESRLPGLQEALSRDQYNALTGVASDIRNSEAAAAVPGLRGSDTQAKIARALDAGLLDSGIAKTLGRVMSFKGIGGETVRNKLAEMVTTHKGKTIAELMADPKSAAKALQDATFVHSIDNKTLQKLRFAVSRGAPILATD
jgi:hypothetical protein